MVDLEHELKFPIVKDEGFEYRISSELLQAWPDKITSNGYPVSWRIAEYQGCSSKFPVGIVRNYASYVYIYTTPIHRPLTLRTKDDTLWGQGPEATEALLLLTFKMYKYPKFIRFLRKYHCEGAHDNLHLALAVEDVLLGCGAQLLDKPDAVLVKEKFSQP